MAVGIHIFTECDSDLFYRSCINYIAVTWKGPYYFRFFDNCGFRVFTLCLEYQLIGDGRTFGNIIKTDETANVKGNGIGSSRKYFYRHCAGSAVEPMRFTEAAGEKMLAV